MRNMIREHQSESDPNVSSCPIDISCSLQRSMRRSGSRRSSRLKLQVAEAAPHAPVRAEPSRRGMKSNWCPKMLGTAFLERPGYYPLGRLLGSWWRRWACGSAEGQSLLQEGSRRRLAFGVWPISQVAHLVRQFAVLYGAGIT